MEKAVSPSHKVANHKEAVEFPSAVDKYMGDEIHVNNVIDPFMSLPVDKATVLSLLNTLPKRLQMRGVLFWTCFHLGLL